MGPGKPQVQAKFEVAMGASGNFGVPLNISATAEISDFKFGLHLRFISAHHKITFRGKCAWPHARGAPKNLEVSVQYLRMADFTGTQLLFSQAHCKVLPRRINVIGPGLWSSPKFGFRFSVSETA